MHVYRTPDNVTMYFAVALIFLRAVNCYDLPGTFSLLKRSHSGLKVNGNLNVYKTNAEEHLHQRRLSRTSVLEWLLGIPSVQAWT
jgi:hypothetical protein